MATAAPHVKLLRQLAAARDDYLSGAFDIAWDTGSATIFVVFGQPSHAVFEAAGTRLEGQPALDALIRELPPQFVVSEWRRTMSPQETLSISIDDLAEPIAALAGESVDTQLREDDLIAWLSAGDDSPELTFDLDSFPLLPAGPDLWDAASPEAVRLGGRLASLTSALITLSGPRLRAAGVVRDGEFIDAVWLDAEDHALGETAAMALLGAREGELSGVGLDGRELAEALPLVWRLPGGEPIDVAWVDAPGVLSALRSDDAERVLVIEGQARGVGLFGGGHLIAAYTSEHLAASLDEALLLELLQRPGSRMRVLQRPGTPAPAPARHEAERSAVTDDVAGRSHPNGETAAAPPESREDGGVPATAESVTAPEPEPPPPPPPPAADDLEETWVDYDEVRRELVQIGIVWLGERDSAPVTQLIDGARPAMEDFVATIDAIRTLNVPGHDPGAVQAMAREMHHHAAERLCGA